MITMYVSLKKLNNFIFVVLQVQRPAWQGLYHKKTNGSLELLARFKVRKLALELMIIIDREFQRIWTFRYYG